MFNEIRIEDYFSVKLEDIRDEKDRRYMQELRNKLNSFYTIDEQVEFIKKRRQLGKSQLEFDRRYLNIDETAQFHESYITTGRNRYYQSELSRRELYNEMKDNEFYLNGKKEEKRADHGNNQQKIDVLSRREKEEQKQKAEEEKFDKNDDKGLKFLGLVRGKDTVGDARKEHDREIKIKHLHEDLEKYNKLNSENGINEDLQSYKNDIIRERQEYIDKENREIEEAKKKAEKDGKEWKEPERKFKEYTDEELGEALKARKESNDKFLKEIGYKKKMSKYVLKTGRGDLEEARILADNDEEITREDNSLSSFLKNDIIPFKSSYYKKLSRKDKQEIKKLKEEMYGKPENRELKIKKALRNYKNNVKNDLAAKKKANGTLKIRDVIIAIVKYGKVAIFSVSAITALFGLLNIGLYLFGIFSSIGQTPFEFCGDNSRPVMSNIGVKSVRMSSEDIEPITVNGAVTRIDKTVYLPLSQDIAVQFLNSADKMLIDSDAARGLGVFYSYGFNGRINRGQVQTDAKTEINQHNNNEKNKKKKPPVPATPVYEVRSDFGSFGSYKVAARWDIAKGNMSGQYYELDQNGKPKIEIDRDKLEYIKNNVKILIRNNINRRAVICSPDIGDPQDGDLDYGVPGNHPFYMGITYAASAALGFKPSPGVCDKDGSGFQLGTELDPYQDTTELTEGEQKCMTQSIEEFCISEIVKNPFAIEAYMITPETTKNFSDLKEGPVKWELVQDVNGSTCPWATEEDEIEKEINEHRQHVSNASPQDEDTGGHPPKDWWDSDYGASGTGATGKIGDIDSESPNGSMLSLVAQSIWTADSSVAAAGGTKEYQELYKVVNKGEAGNPLAPPGCRSCDHTSATVVRLLDPHYPFGSTKVIHDYLKTGQNGWIRIQPTNVSQCKPGDVFIVEPNGHVITYMGNNKFWEGSIGIVEQGYRYNYGGKMNNFYLRYYNGGWHDTLKKPRLYYVYRNTKPYDSNLNKKISQIMDKIIPSGKRKDDFNEGMKKVDDLQNNPDKTPPEESKPKEKEKKKK